MTRKELNDVYEKLDLKAMELSFPFNKIHGIFQYSVGFYNGHYSKNKSGEYQMDYFPIPVISIKNMCDIEIGIEKISVSTKLKKEEALKFNYSKLNGYMFEAYGVENYLENYYIEGDTIEQLIEKVQNSEEKEIGFAFFLSDDIDGDTIYKFVKFLKRNGFYY